jgi:twinfilin-like protein
VHDNLAEKQPAYFLVRLGDSKTSAEWIFLCYVPDVAPIRQKMIYAATRASLTRDLGDSHFTDSIYGTNKVSFVLLFVQMDELDVRACPRALVRDINYN